MKTRSKFDKRILLSAFAVCAPHIAAQERPAHFPVSPSAVVTALRESGVPVDATQIQMPQNLTATSNQPLFRITGAELLSDGRLRVRLSCQDLGACQPFFVSAVGLAPGTELATLASLRSTPAGGKHSGTGNPAMVKAGGQAQMVLQDERMRISIPVVTMDTGSVGAEVRASSLDHKQTFRAFVVSEGVVRGVLP